MLLTLLLSVTPPDVRGDDLKTGLMPLDLIQEETQPVTSRSPRPISKIAENITVITREEIARLNAHSLSDILQTVPGLQVDSYQSPGNFTFFKIQGQSDVNATILLLVDGISQGNLIQGTSDPGMIPVQHIERIEIIKGAASATWGAALGGVVNVVTKNPDTERAIGGTIGASHGEKNTSDLTAELTGSSNGFGYYLSGGNLHSNGLLPNNGTNRNSLYAKLTYDLPAKGNITGGISYVETSRGLVEIYDRDFDYIEHDDNSDRRYHSFLSFSSTLLPELSVELTGYDSTIHNRSSWGERTDIVTYYADRILDQRNSGGKAKVLWGDSLRNLTTGIEYQHSSIDNRDRLNLEAPDTLKRRRDSLSAYANGTFTLGRLTLLPGIRYDKTGLDEDTTNYTVGATYRLGEATLLRGYWATGYGLPNAFLKSIPARVRTFQAGIESEAVPYLWLKGTYFYNHLWHIQDYWGDPDTFYTNDFQGFELEIKTVPVAGVSFKAGYTFTDAKDKDSGQTIKGVPRHLAKLAVSYVDPSHGTDLLLTGNYAWLNMDSWGDADRTWSHRPHYNPIIWNLHLNQKLLPESELSPEFFFTINNLFNGSQYWDYWYKNPGRWVEGGVRFRF
jgi:vitamin B12 transporter